MCAKVNVSWYLCASPEKNDFHERIHRALSTATSSVKESSSQYDAGASKESLSSRLILLYRNIITHCYITLLIKNFLIPFPASNKFPLPPLINFLSWHVLCFVVRNSIRGSCR